jgi:hypothetical protein
MGVHRFRIKADVEQAELRQVIEAGLTVDQSAARLETDITLVDDALLPDLTSVMESAGYEFVTTTPTIPLADRFPDSIGNLWGLRIIQNLGFFGKVNPAGVASLLAAEPGLFNGGIIETIDLSVTEAAGVVSLNLQKAGGGNLTIQLSDNLLTYTAGSVTLSAGTDTVPVLNYVWIEDVASVATLMAGTAGWPANEHNPVATVIVQSAAGVSADGAYKVHAWTDHVKSTNGQGHLSHLNFWIRQQAATWLSGVVPNLTITTQGASNDNVQFDNGAGVDGVLQLHEHTFPLRDQASGDPIFVINDSASPYRQTTDFGGATPTLTDSTGGSMSGRYFSLVIWGVVSESAADCKLMCNLPSGSYNNQTDLVQDLSGFADFSIPDDYKGTGFLIAQLQLRHQVSGNGTWTEIDLIDLRGQFPGTTAGGTTASASQFSDALFRIFDNGDDTKKIAFEASGVATGTVRTVTMPNKNILLDGEKQILADQMENPVNADWAVNALAPVSADSDNAALNVRLFDDTIEEGAGFTLSVPAAATNMTVRMVSRAETAPVAARTVGTKLYNRGIPNDAAVTAWTAGVQLTDLDIPTNENFQYDEQTETLAAWGLTAGQVHQLELTRVDPTGGVELVGDWALLSVSVEFS